MFNLEWRELLFLAVVGVFWLVVLARIYHWWSSVGTLSPAYAPIRPHHARRQP
jgi:hypothetical protein